MEDGNDDDGPGDPSQDGSQSGEDGRHGESGDEPHGECSGHSSHEAPVQAQEEGTPPEFASSPGHEKAIKGKKDKKGKKVERQRSGTSQDSQFSFNAHKNASENTRRNDYKIDQTPIS